MQEVREEVGVVAPEVGKELRIFVHPQKLAYDLDGEDLRVAQRWGGSATSETSEILDAVVYKAEDADDEGVKIHWKRPPSLRLVWAPPSVRRSPLLFNRSEKRAHGVS
jgi:hypothetical protein